MVLVTLCQDHTVPHFVVSYLSLKIYFYFFLKGAVVLDLFVWNPFLVFINLLPPGSLSQTTFQGRCILEMGV